MNLYLLFSTSSGYVSFEPVQSVDMAETYLRKNETVLGNPQIFSRAVVVDMAAPSLVATLR